MPIALNSIKLQLYTDDEIRKIAVVQVTNPSTYDRGLPKANGVNDPRMGVTDKALQCPSCGLTATCNNHYGFIELERPVLRLGHIASALSLLRSVCWACSRPKFSLDQKEGFVDVRAIVARTSAGSKDRLRGIGEACKNRFKCPWTGGDSPCGAPQPVYSRVNKVFFGRTFRPKEAALLMPEEAEYLSRRLMPDEIQSIFRHIPHEALSIMGYKPETSHPLNYIFKAQLVPPPSIRPATAAASTEARMRGENDLTVALQDIVRANNELAACINDASKDSKDSKKNDLKIEVAWDKLQIFCAALINQNSKKLCTFNGTTVVHARAMGKRKTKVIKDRLTGKKGRLRGNLSGKRVDQAGRTVVGPDASRDIFELGVPATIMRTLTFPEPVNLRNVRELAAAVAIGANERYGALTVRQCVEDSEEKVLHLSLLDAESRRALACQLKPGWTVERHLRDGDWILFNRQPSLHKASIMAFKAYEVLGLQFKLPLPCTKPFNADFDGDEMNIHALQDYAAIAEAQEIMAVPHQMVTPQNNSVLIALVQDSIVGAYLMSRKDAFCDRERAIQLAMCIHHNTEKDYSSMPSGKTFFDLFPTFPEPAVLKGPRGPLWTGKQILSWILPSCLSLSKPSSDDITDLMDEKIVFVRCGQLLAGRLCKQTVGASSGGIVHELWKRSGPWAAAKFVSDAQRILMLWLRQDSVSISIRDCLTPCEPLVDDITAAAMGKVESLETADIPFAVKEVRQSQLLQETLRTVGASVLDHMDNSSGIAIVVASGSKGNLMNIAQIAGLVGQQTINGARISFRKGPKGPRTLANFFPGDNSPEARGFVASSYMMGLQPAEFFFHQQAGREGVVATAVSTADTGYNQRRMVKNQESEVVAYDLSVRVSSNLIVQQHYGGDDYDGSMVERVKLEEPLEALMFDGTPVCEKLWLTEAYKTLKAFKKEVSMPVNFGRLLSNRATSSKKVYNCENLLQSLLKGILEAHGANTSDFNTIDDFIFWRRRDWRIIDDPSLSARLAVTLQCNTRSISKYALCTKEQHKLADEFLKLYARGIVNPGEGVGAVGSSSIGEPSTQMTLNIFHYSGIAEKNVTLTGLPRFKQIINAVDTYDTANMRIHFTSTALGSNDAQKFNARSISSRLVRTGLSIITSSSKVQPLSSLGLAAKLQLLTSETFEATRGAPLTTHKALDSRIAAVTQSQKRGSPRLSTFVAVYNLDKSAMASRCLSVEDVGAALAAFMGLDSIVTWTARWEKQWQIFVQPPLWSSPEFDEVVTEAVRDALLEHNSVNGIDSIKKAVPLCEASTWIVETEGSDFLEVAQLAEVDALNTTTNNIQEVVRVLGVEAALILMQSELHRVLSFDGSYVDPRHTWLLADTVARSGNINPLNRHKMEELGGSLLQCASFEQTLEVFEQGAAFGKSDSLGGATEKLIVGQPVHVGTGSFEIVAQDLPAESRTFVAPLSQLPEADEQRVMGLRSEYFFDSDEKVVSLHKRQKVHKVSFVPPSELSSYSKSHAFEPLVACMRKKAQLREPIWIVSELPQLSKADFGDIEKALEAYSGWMTRPKNSDYLQFTQVEYEVNGFLVTSRVDYSCGITANHFIKSIVENAELELPSLSLLAWAESRAPLDADNLPQSVSPVKVQVRHEKVFEKGAWILRLSRVWEGENIVEAEQNQRGGSNTCEYFVNIELEKPWDLLEMKGSTDSAIAESFVERAVACIDCILSLEN